MRPMFLRNSGMSNPINVKLVVRTCCINRMKLLRCVGVWSCMFSGPPESHPVGSSRGERKTQGLPAGGRIVRDIPRASSGRSGSCLPLFPEGGHQRSSKERCFEDCSSLLPKVTATNVTNERDRAEVHCSGFPGNDPHRGR